jgi:alpha-beta hydrolase superfamily lysophospholipase
VAERFGEPKHAGASEPIIHAAVRRRAMTVNETALPVSPTSNPVNASEDTLQVRDGTGLHTYRWSSRLAEAQSSAVVLLVHGYSEYGRRYDALARYLVGRGHPTYCFDMRGHGFSPGQRGHIDRYDRYVDDCTDVARDIAQRHPGRPLVLLGHSNGGLTVLRTVQRGEVSPAGLIMTCPMVALQPKRRTVPRGLAGALGVLLGRLSLPNGIESSALSRDAALNKAWSADPMNHGKTTIRWYTGALDAMELGMAEASKVTLPVLTFAGELDSIVDPKGVEKLSEQLASPDREFVTCRGAFHEVLNEPEREQYFKRIGDWLAARFGN